MKSSQSHTGRIRDKCGFEVKKEFYKEEAIIGITLHWEEK